MPDDEDPTSAPNAQASWAEQISANQGSVSSARTAPTAMVYGLRPWWFGHRLRDMSLNVDPFIERPKASGSKL